MAVLLSAVVAGPAAAEASPASGGSDTVEEQTVPGRIVVRWATGTSESAREEARAGQGAWTIEATEPLHMELLGVRSDRVETVVTALNARPDVVFAEPEFVIESAATDDPEFGQLWGLHNTGQSGGVADVDLDAPEAWEVTRGSREVIVAVIDTGVQITHPDLAANIWVNEAEANGQAGVDDDSNGYVDDVNGWDFKHGNASVYDGASEDDHGTHVAGTIAAVADNQTGLVGVAPNVRIMPLKFLGGDTGTGSSYDASLAVAYAAAKGARIINASWGGGGGTSLATAIKNASGVAFVAAAGNQGLDTDVDPFYPGSWAKDSHGMPTVLSVASITRSGALSGFSNYGLASVDVAAPGSSIYSTLAFDTYGSYSGTSMAAPHASGVAALIASLRPDLDGAGLVAAVKGGVSPLSAVSGRTTTGGLVNAYDSVEPYHAPGSPTGVTGVAGNGEAAISWTAPTSGGAPTSYTVTVSPDTGVTGGTSRSVDAPATTLLFDGLTNDTAYTFTVTATNAGGTSPASASSAAVTPSPTVPTAPTGLTAVNGDGFVDLDWAEPTDDGGAAVTGYSVTVAPTDGVTGDTTRTVTSPTTALRFDGLTNGTAYTFAVSATNSVGTGAAVTSAELTPRVLTAPDAPTGLTVVTDHNSATVTWTAPVEDGGRPVTGYVVTATTVPAEGEEASVVATVETATTSATVTGLSNGSTYVFAASARNEIGTGTSASSGPTTLPVLTAPGAPTAVTATAGDGSTTVTWTAPADDGGKPVTSYTVTADPGGATATSSTTSATVTGLTNGTAYTFTVTATNAVGTGAASDPSAAVTPVAPPAPPPSGGGGGGGGGGGAAAPAPAPAPSPTAPGSTSGEVDAGGTVTTDPDGTGATTDAPAQTAVTSPVAGPVTVEMTDVRIAAPEKWSLLAVEVNITAPVATADQPLALDFRLDGSLDALGAVPFRNGVPVPDCLGSRVAAPDPCVSARSTAGDDVVLTVLTSRASTWNFGHPAVACPDGRVAAASFTDVSGVHAASIGCLSWWNVTSGLTATTYGAAATVRRDQMASFIARTLTEAGIDLPQPGDRFADADGGTHGDNIEALAAAGIVAGSGSDRYAPGGQVTRAQMATFLAATVEYATGQPLPTADGAFGDLGSNVHAGAVEAVHAAGLVRGTGPDTFAPGRPVTRAQMASFLVNLLDLLVERGITRPPVR